jgi:hypothetical protein
MTLVEILAAAARLAMARQEYIPVGIMMVTAVFFGLAAVNNERKGRKPYNYALCAFSSLLVAAVRMSFIAWNMPAQEFSWVVVTFRVISLVVVVGLLGVVIYIGVKHGVFASIFRSRGRAAMPSSTSVTVATFGLGTLPHPADDADRRDLH